MALVASSDHGWIRISISNGRLIQEGNASLFRGYRLGTKSSQELDGVYAGWHWDGHTLEVSACDTGFLPVFYYMTSHEVIVATGLRDLFEKGGVAPTVDQRALAVFLRLGFFIGNSTPFQNVHVLGPSGRLHWSSDKQLVKDGYPGYSPTAQSVTEAVDTYVEVFRSAVSRIAEEAGPGCAVPLSGGRDSRHIALELHRQGLRPKFAVTAFHRPPRPNEDIRIAKLLCERLGWPHLSAEQPLDWFGQERRHVDDVEYLSYEHAWTLPIRDKLSAHGIEFAFDGAGGDILSAGLYQDDLAVNLYKRRQLSDLAIKLVERWGWLGGDVGLMETCGPELPEVVKKETAIDAIREELARHVDHPNPLKSFYFWNRTRRGTGLLPFKILDRFTVFTPYLAPEVRDFLMSLPHSFTADTTFHTRAIRRADEHIASIGYEDKLASRTKIPLLQGSFYSAKMCAACLGAGRGALWRPGFVFPRALKSFASGNIGAMWWKPRRVIYLLALSKFISK